MMKKKWPGILLLLVMLGLAACGVAAEHSFTIRVEEATYKLPGENRIALNYHSEIPVVTLSDHQAAAQSINLRSEALQKALIGENPRSGMLTEKPDGELYNDILQEMADWAEYWYATVMEYSGDYDFPGFELTRTVAGTRLDGAVVSFLYTDQYWYGNMRWDVDGTGYNYDAVTGQLLTLDTIAKDAEALRSFCLERILTLSKTEAYEDPVGYPIFYEGYEEYLPEIMEEGRWYFTEDGLVFSPAQFSIAPGRGDVILFEIPYDDLKGLVWDRYLL